MIDVPPCKHIPARITEWRVYVIEGTDFMQEIIRWKCGHFRRKTIGTVKPASHAEAIFRHNCRQSGRHYEART